MNFFACGIEFLYLMRLYLVVVLYTAECERIFSRLKLVKALILRNRLDYSLERIMQVALNGSSLAEAMLDGGEVDQALMYFFSRQNRNLKVPAKCQMQQTLVQKLDLLTWCLKVPHPEIVIEEKMQDSESS